ncbi:MAG: type II toxin-antitoxin system VapC family toxin [Burkholderiales bacterium]
MTTRLDAAVIDSSALLCIALAEPAAACFLEGFARTDRLYIGAATRAETWLAVHYAKGPGGAQKIDALIEALDVELVDFSAASLPHFRQGGAAYHHKFHDRARLNIGDLFTYALAKQLDLPLFFQGSDFLHADLANAMTILGYGMSVSGVPQEIAPSR